METIDVEEYHRAIRSRVSSVGGIFDMVFNKQAKDLGISGAVDPKDVDELIERTAEAMEFFVGANMKKTIKRIMRSELRKRAPIYFERKYGMA